MPLQTRLILNLYIERMVLALQLPKDLLSDTYRAPNVFLCQTNKERIGQLNVISLSGTFRWNNYSEVSLEIARTETDNILGTEYVNPYYDLTEGLRLIYVEGFGYFQLQDPSINADGVQETKSINAYSTEYMLAQRFLENIVINKGTTESIDDVQLYDEINPERSLLHLILSEKAPDWMIGHVDAALSTLQRSFSITGRTSVYDFIMNDLCNTFKCVAVFNTIDNSINLYAEDSAGQDTNVFISFENLATKVAINYSTDNIKTVFSVSGADDLNIRDVNFGLSTITDLSFYHTVEWMGQDLYDAYANYCALIESKQTTYDQALHDLQTADETILELQNRHGENLTHDKLSDFNSFLVDYYKTQTIDVELLSGLKSKFDFVNSDVWDTFEKDIQSSGNDHDNAILVFLDEVWNEFGLTELESVWLPSYKGVQTVQSTAGWSNPESENYYAYHANYIMLISVEDEIQERNTEIENVQKTKSLSEEIISDIAVALSMQTNFTNEQLIRLAPFLREDEYSDDCFVIIDTDTESDILETKRELKNAATKELTKRAQPQLSFTTEMANIFSMDEFSVLHSQFDLGNMIRIALRPDYIKKSRLMEISINFYDFLDFSVTFGDLLSIRDEADIHADLLSQAISAGKQVANSSSYWQKGSDAATAIQQKITQGLLDAATSIKSIDGNQNSFIDKYGIHLQTIDENGNVDPKQGWIVNNQILYSSDGFKTSNAVFGEYTYDGKTLCGLLANAVVAGYIEGSAFVGGQIKIGLQADGSYAFEVREDGAVVMNGGGSSNSFATKSEIEDVQQGLLEINQAKMYRVEIICSGPQIMNIKNQTATLSCRVYSWDTDITDTLDSTLFNWTRSSNDSDQDEIWNNNSVHQGRKTLTISTEDITNNASFNCEVTLPD